MHLCCCVIITAAAVFSLMLNATAFARIQTAAAECVNKSSLCSYAQTHTHILTCCVSVSVSVYTPSPPVSHLSESRQLPVSSSILYILPLLFVCLS